VTTLADAVRRVLTDASGEAVCEACLTIACGASLADTRAAAARLLDDAHTAFVRRAGCARCRRDVLSIVHPLRCVHCREPIGAGEQPARFESNVFHALCMKIVIADQAIGTSTDHRRTSLEHIERPRRLLGHAPDPQNGGSLIVVVDDDVSVRRGLSRLLSTAGYRVWTFASGRELLEWRTADTPSCLVLDVRMPGLSGVAVHEALRAAGQRVPVIFITGDADIPETTRASAGSSVAILSKPVDDDELFATVQRLIAASEVPSAST
jgi:CheY-like chemotaxis protein